MKVLLTSYAYKVVCSLLISAKMPKVLILPHFHYEDVFSDFLNVANSVQSDFRFYLLPPESKDNSPLKKPVADYLEILGFLHTQKKQMNLDPEDLLVAFYEGVITALDHKLANLFIAGGNLDDIYPCTAAVSLKFISWGILEQKYDYSLQRHALFHLVMCSLIGGYTQVSAHYQTHGCLLDFNNHLIDFNRKLQMGYYLCSDLQNGCYSKLKSERYGNSIIKLCTILRESIDQKKLQVIIKQLIMGNKFENIHNSTIINESLVQNAFNQAKEQIDEDTANALVEIASEVEKSKNVAAGALLNNFMEELNAQQPDKSKLRQCWEGLVAVLPSIATLTAASAKIATIFA